MMPHITKLIKEREEFKVKIDNLHNFMLSNTFAELTFQKQSLLRVQLKALETCYECILLRLEDDGVND